MAGSILETFRQMAATRDTGLSWTDVEIQTPPQQARIMAATPSSPVGHIAKSKPDSHHLSEDIIIAWEGTDDPLDPKNWSGIAKWTVTLIMSAFSLVTLISSSMIAPALPSISAEMDIRSDIEAQMVFSSFILASAFGAVIFAPLSEKFGRKSITLWGNAYYIVWSIVCGFAPNKSVMILARFMSGFGASVVFGVSYGLLSDCWRPEERGKSMAIINFVPLLGPALGPVIGAFVVQNTTWRWIFWAIAIFDGALELVAFFFLWETYPPVLLARKAKALRKQTGTSKVRTKYEVSEREPDNNLARSLKRPLVIIAKHPAAQAVTVYGAVGFGVLYIMLSDFASVWMTVYHQPVSDSGLHYLSLVIGFTLGSQGCAFLMDRMWRRALAAGTARPEIRTVFLWPGVACWVIGLLLYGWAAQFRLHWILCDIGAAIFGLGAQLGTSASGAYITDTYTIYTASASAGSFAVRSLFAFFFPLFAPYLYQALGYGWGNSLLALCCAIAGCIVSGLIWRYGARWRASVNMAKLA